MRRSSFFFDARESRRSSRLAMRQKRSLVEIFGVTLLEKVETLDTRQVLEENLLLYSQFHHDRYEYVLYDISFGKDIQINSEGQLILHGPHHGIEVGLFFSMSPYHHPFWSSKSPKILWTDSEMTDCFRTGCLETKNGFIVVNFAVYSDGLEAKLDISISDLKLSETLQMGTSLEFYGMVTTSNSAITHSHAKSVLFDCSDSSNSVAFGIPTGEAEITLPLSRRVTVIPKESDLIVNVSLFVKCSSEDISIANGSVLFQAGSRSSADVEDQIIRGSHGKVKVKVTWMEAMKDGVSTKEEEEETIKEIEPESQGEEIDRRADSAEGEKDPESGWISDDDRSSVSIKVPRIESQEDVSTRASDSSLIETIETDRSQVANLNSNSQQRLKHSLLEVFSVKISNFDRFSLDEIYGFIMIDTCSPTHLLFRRVHGDPCKINAQGFAILDGPRAFAWSVNGEVLIVPFLFKYQEFDFVDEEIHADYLWHDDEYDKLLCKRLNDDVGCIEVNFAVYEDAVEAHLDVMLTNCSFSSSKVSATMIASNSMLQDPGAMSVVSIEESCEDLDVNSGSVKDIALSLSRSIIAVPFGSTLKLVFDICSQDMSTKGLSFEFPVDLTGVSEKIKPGNGCSVRVKVSFFSKQPTQLVDLFF